MADNLSIVWLHLVWSTRDRLPLIKKSYRGDLNRFIKEEAINKGIQVDTINGMEDHIHVLLRLRTSQKISDLVNWLKGRSSKWINENYYEEGYFKWQKGYGVFSVGINEVNKVRNYIYNQEKHHLSQTYYQEIDFFQNKSKIDTLKKGDRT